MGFEIRLENSVHPFQDNSLFFQGYINHNGKLLYDAEAASVIADTLESRTPEELLKSLNGAFRLIYLKDKTLYFTVDHFGGYSLFYRLKDTSLLILDNPMQQCAGSKLNDSALCSLLATGFTLYQDTIFDDILECNSGTLYIFNLNTAKLEAKKWFNYYSKNEKPLDASKLSQIFRGLFPDPGNGQYTLSLSGGIDSRTLFGLLLSKGLNFQTFSFGSDYNQDKHFASRLSSQFGIRHHVHNFTPEICREYYTDQDLDFILKNCTFGRSLPNETDLISSRSLNPQEDIIVKGFGGDWLTGRYITPELMQIETEEQMTRYLFAKYFQLTCISSPSFMKLLWKQLENLLQTKYYPYNPGLVSAEEQWNEHHNERKYIINTLAYYKAQGYRFYLPFFDRNLMQCFSKLQFQEKIDQIGYFIYLRKYFFIGKLSPLRELPTLRGNFTTPFAFNGMQRIRIKLHKLIRNMDTKKIRKRFFIPSASEYADTLMLFNKDSKTCPYLKKTIGDNFPTIHELADLLKSRGCANSAAHLHWLSFQSTSQINVNGISICNFFLNPQFLDFINQLQP